MPSLPTYLPIGQTENRQTGQNRSKPIKRISFDDDVQVIGVSEPDQAIIENEKRFLSYFKQPYQANPKKLYSSDSTCQAAPPREFLHDLQKVMTKKWQVAEKCKKDQNTSPHQVLGFRDNDIQKIHQIVGHGQDYSRDETVGAWVLHSQQYANQKITNIQNIQYTNTHQNHQENLQKEPLYAICSKSGPKNFMGNSPTTPPGPNGPNHYAGPMPNGPNHYAASTASPKKVPMPVVPPVVLREPIPHHPEPTYVVKALPEQLRNNCGQVTQPPYVQPQHCHQYPPHHMANLKKRAPPPPRRSQNTHLTTTS